MKSSALATRHLPHDTTLGAHLQRSYNVNELDTGKKLSLCRNPRLHTKPAPLPPRIQRTRCVVHTHTQEVPWRCAVDVRCADKHTHLKLYCANRLKDALNRTKQAGMSLSSHPTRNGWLDSSTSPPTSDGTKLWFVWRHSPSAYTHQHTVVGASAVMLPLLVQIGKALLHFDCTNLAQNTHIRGGR